MNHENRFMAVECDDGKARIWDEETRDWGRVTFAGTNAFDMATGCARMWNWMHEAQKKAVAQAFEDWLNLPPSGSDTAA